MVGDAKQSIYRFRRADPGMFLKMLDTYTHDDSESERIDLSHNFRSRPEVLGAVNYLFAKICSKELGDVPYDDSAKLYPGHDKYPEIRTHMQVEIFDEAVEDDEQEDADIDVPAVISETRMIAGCIHELLATRKIYENGGLRDCNLGDIVILTRGLSSIAGDVLAELGAQGIAAVSESNVSFFGQAEIKFMRSFLRIVDNPRQDIELIAVLRSPAYDFSPEELFEISRFEVVCSCGAVVSDSDGACPECQDMLRIDLYDRLFSYAQGSDKARSFLDDLLAFRESSVILPVSRLINRIYDITSYPSFAASLPGGDVRMANLRLLVQKAVEFEQTGRTGLFQFNLYLDRLEKADSLASSTGAPREGGNFVRLMTIHKSKGLEFPIVFVSFLAKQFNVMDTRSSVILHPRYGIGPYFVDTALRTRANTLARFSLSKLTHYENLSEEMRCLYVAMTRAKDLLVLTARVRDLEKSLQKWKDEATDEAIPVYYLKSARSYLDWLMPCLVTNTQSNLGFLHPAGFKVRVHTKQAMTATPSIDARTNEPELRTGASYIEAYDETPFALPSKLSISEIIRLYDMSPDSTPVREEISRTFELPAFLRVDRKVSQAEIGQAVHVILEHLDYFHHRTRNKLMELTDYLIGNSYVAKEAAKAVDIGQILHFVNSSLADRMRASGKIHRETPFVLAIESGKVFNVDSAEKILVHGIIDCHFVESGMAVLVDFKNDRIPSKTKPEEWAKTHGVQLGIYREALVKSTGMEVAEVLLHSFYLGREIILP